MGRTRDTLIWLSRSEFLAERATDLPFLRRAVRRFMPGERLEDALGAARSLAGDGIGTLFTRLGENVESDAEAEAVADHYRAAIDRIAAAGLDGEISVKLTQLGLGLDREATARRVDDLAERAGTAGSRVWIDMEESRFVAPTLELYRGLRPSRPCLGVCLQAYLRRTADDLADLLPLEPAIRLVKGAYREPAAIAFSRKADTDASYLGLARTLLAAAAEGRARAGLATHDGRLIERLLGAVREAGVADSHYEVEMLYGIRAGEQRRLAAAGVPTRVLISYGSEWFPWYMRRLAERPANVWFVLRNLLPGRDGPRAPTAAS